MSTATATPPSPSDAGPGPGGIAHDRAVEAALTHLEGHVAATRAGRNGVRHLDVGGVAVARYRHRTSRNGDPLLHTHCAVATKVRTVDAGRWRTLDGARIFEAGPEMNALYTSTLEAELTDRLGAAWRPRVDGRGRELAAPRPGYLYEGGVRAFTTSTACPSPRSAAASRSARPRSHQAPTPQARLRHRGRPHRRRVPPRAAAQP